MRRLYKTIWVCILMVIFLYPISAYANSSWHWVTYSPKKILPYAVFFTLIIETLGIAALGKVNEKRRTFTVVAIANIVSFVFPYIERANRFRAVAGGFIYAWDKAFNSGPYYLILFGYFVLTLALEIPVVYFLLKEHSRNRRNLLYAIVLFNLITTAGVFIIERLVSHGQW